MALLTRSQRHGVFILKEKSSRRLIHYIHSGHAPRGLRSLRINSKKSLVVSVMFKSSDLCQSNTVQGFFHTSRFSPGRQLTLRAREQLGTLITATVKSRLLEQKRDPAMAQTVSYGPDIAKTRVQS
jgi:hypothetical protein